MMRHLFTTTKPNRDDCSAEHMVIKININKMAKITVIITSQQATTI